MGQPSDNPRGRQRPQGPVAASTAARSDTPRHAILSTALAIDTAADGEHMHDQQALYSATDDLTVSDRASTHALGDAAIALAAARDMATVYSATVDLAVSGRASAPVCSAAAGSFAAACDGPHPTTAETSGGDRTVLPHIPADAEGTRRHPGLDADGDPCSKRRRLRGKQKPMTPASAEVCRATHGGHSGPQAAAAKQPLHQLRRDGGGAV